MLDNISKNYPDITDEQLADYDAARADPLTAQFAWYLLNNNIVAFDRALLRAIRENASNEAQHAALLDVQRKRQLDADRAQLEADADEQHAHYMDAMSRNQEF